MSKHLSSAKSAKDKFALVDLDDLALAMHADSTFMTDAEYADAQTRLAKRKAIMQPRKPIRPSKYGMFMAGIMAGAVLAALIAFVMSVSGMVAGITVAVTTGIVLVIIGIHIRENE